LIFLKCKKEDEKFIFVAKDKYQKYKQRKCRVKMKSSSETEIELNHEKLVGVGQANDLGAAEGQF